MKIHNLTHTKTSKFLFFPLLCFVLFSCTWLSGCTTANNPQEDKAIAGSWTTQGNIPDDLDASLEEAVLTLTSEVSDTISRIHNLDTPKGTPEDQHQQYTELRTALNNTEQRIENLEETVETNYRASMISEELCHKLTAELESLEELMDASEDQLALTFGVSD